MDIDTTDLVVAFDTEYVSDTQAAQNSETLDYDAAVMIRKGNRVLCFSFSIYHPASEQRFSGIVNLPPERRQRWTLKQLLEKAVEAMLERGVISRERLAEADDRKPARKRRSLRIVLVGHFTRADLPGFGDFRRLKRKFSAVRKTYVSIATPLVISLRPGRLRTMASVTLRDTRLLTPEGFGSLAAIGNMLGHDKLEVPEVTDETGATRPGIERMDLVQERHPELFKDYAIRDAELALEYLLKVYELAREMGVLGIPATIGAISVRLFKDRSTAWAAFVGRVPGDKRKLVMHPVLATYSGIWADAYRGGRNQAFAHGIFTAPAGRVWNDIDVASAYTTAMAALPPIDWDSASMPARLEDLTTLDAATVARVRFRFPEGTRFPCIAVPAEAGLIFPLEGEATICGPELVTAQNMGAEIEVMTGLRFEYAEGVHEYAGFTRTIAEYRARYKKDNPLFERLVKTAGNSLYGKVSQAVAGMRATDPDRGTMFDTITGRRQILPASSLTNPVHAALTTSIIRAVLGEILAGLPADRTVLSVTTDGFLTDATLEEALAATEGPVTAMFKRALECVAPGKPVLEVKHRAAKVIVARTRGAFSVEAAGGYTGPPILARAGHKLDDAPEDAWEEAAAFARLFRDRTPTTTLRGRDFVSVQDQWMADSDLVALPVSRRINLDYDMGCQPVGVGEDEDGLLRFTTHPWRHKGAYTAARKAHATLRKDAGHLKTMTDWKALERALKAAGEAPAPGPVLHNLKAARLALALECREGRTSYEEAAARMGALGLPTTKRQMWDAATRARKKGLMGRRGKRYLKRGNVPNSSLESEFEVPHSQDPLILLHQSCPKLEECVSTKGVQMHSGPSLAKNAPLEEAAGARLPALHVAVPKSTTPATTVPTITPNQLQARLLTHGMVLLGDASDWAQIVTRLLPAAFPTLSDYCDWLAAVPPGPTTGMPPESTAHWASASIHLEMGEDLRIIDVRLNDAGRKLLEAEGLPIGTPDYEGAKAFASLSEVLPDLGQRLNVPLPIGRAAAPTPAF